MSKYTLFTLHVFLVICFLLFFHSPLNGAEIAGLEVRLQENEIHITTALSLEATYLDELSNGITKEFRFYIDLFKVWNMWPDEFVLGKSFIRTLKCDPVKKEYIATSFDGNTLIEKRFKSFESMISWSLNINNLKLAHMRELEPGVYFVRITVESRIRKLPPVIGYFIIFFSENEFKITKDSSFFSIGAGR
ncbi:MAG: DUF4390 domain-containing protein [Nitrospira sp.]|nr:DUF4390 domain-containing protein [Nitrospira sp.]